MTLYKFIIDMDYSFHNLINWFWDRNHEYWYFLLNQLDMNLRRICTNLEFQGRVEEEKEKDASSYHQGHIYCFFFFNSWNEYYPKFSMLPLPFNYLHTSNNPPSMGILVNLTSPFTRVVCSLIHSSCMRIFESIIFSTEHMLFFLH